MTGRGLRLGRRPTSEVSVPSFSWTDAEIRAVCEAELEPHINNIDRA